MRRAPVLARRSLWLALLSLVLLPLLGPGVPTARAEQLDLSNVWHGGPIADGMLVADRVIVHFAPGAVPTITAGKSGELTTDRADVNAVDQRFGVHAFARLFGDKPRSAQKLAGFDVLERIYAVDFDPQFPLADVVAAFQALPGVTQVEPVGLHHFMAVVPNDPQLNSQVWLRANTPGARDIRALAGWAHSAGDTSVVLADGDSGVDWQHPDLGGSGPNYARGNMWINWAEYNGAPLVDDDLNGKTDDIRGWDFVTGVTGEQTPPQDVNTPDNDPMDYEGHGTSTAGCMTAIANNATGVVGAAWRCKVMALRVGWLQAGSSIGVVRMDFAAQAISYATANGAKAFNASWGSSNSGGLGAAVDNASANNVLVVTAAGNDNLDSPSYLASRADVIAVAAVNSSDARASFTNFGTWVDVCAPGVGTLTTAFNRFGVGAAQHSYDAPSGTSFASPITCAVAGIIYSAFPGITAAQVRARLIAAVDEVDSRNPAFAGMLGSGRVNIAKVFNDHFFQIPNELPTVADALNTADTQDTVAVAGGAILDERVTLQARSVYVLGGWNPTFSSRDPINNKSILHPSSGEGAVLRAPAPIDTTVIVDGFEISGGVAIDQPFEPVTGRYGGGVLIKGGSPKLRNLKVDGNTAGSNNPLGSGGGGGAGIAVLSGNPVFEDIEVTNNTALIGPAVYVYRGAPAFRRANIHDNISLPGDGFSAFPDGGAVYIIDTNAPKKADVVSFYGSTISGHNVAGDGGGIYAQNSVLRLWGVTVRDNTATGNGVGLFLSGGSLDARNNTFQHNTRQGTVNNFGGGLYALNASVTLNGDTFRGNTAGFGGGGIYLDGCANASLTNVLAFGNTAAFFGSGAQTNGSSGVTITSCTVANNTGAAAGANGLYLSGGSATLSKNIFAFNGGGGSTLADGVHCQGSTTTFSCNVAFGNTAGNYGGCPDPTGSNGNVAGDPLFVNAAAFDYRVCATSPAAPAQSGACGLIGALGFITCSTGVEDHPQVTPARFAVEQNSPNPFNPRTVIRFELPTPGRARVTVYDLRGRTVRVLVDADLSAGAHDVTWNGLDDAGRAVSSGTYLYEVCSGDQRSVRKMGLLK